MKIISYVLPIYNEEGNIQVLYDTINKVTDPLSKKYSLEIIFVNDGSRDNSIAVLKRIVKKDHRIRVIDFARNYGHQIAVTAGIDYAKGDAIIIMDSDMQDPPRVSIELIKKWEDGYEVVYAQRRSRKDSLFKRITASIYYKTLSRIANIDIPENTGDFRLIDKRIAEELKRYPEHNRFLRGMISNIGFNQTSVLFDREERLSGTTGYPLKKMVKFATDGILGFSTAPLNLIISLGSMMAIASFIGILYALSVKILIPNSVVEGWTFITISIFLVGGIQLIMLGVLGSYIGRIYTEVQNRPLYSVQKIYEKQ